SRASHFFTNFLTLRTASAGVSASVAMGVAWVLHYRGEALAAVFFGCVYMLSMELTNYCRAYYQAFENLRQESIMLLVEKSLVIGGGVVGLLATRAAWGTLAGMGLGMLLTTLLNTAWVRRHLAPVRRDLLDWAFLRRSLRIMLP